MLLLQSLIRSFSVTLLVPHLGAMCAHSNDVTVTLSTHSRSEIAPLSKPINVVLDVSLSETTIRGRDVKSHGVSVHFSGPIAESMDSPMQRSSTMFPTSHFWTQSLCPSDFAPSDALSPSSTEGGIKSLRFSVSAAVGSVIGPSCLVFRDGSTPAPPWLALIPQFRGEAAYRRVALSVSISQPHLAFAWHTIDTTASGMILLLCCVR